LAYARGAVVICPSLETYEGRLNQVISLPSGAGIEEIEHEFEDFGRAVDKGNRSINS
jgi:hypothetical protein